MTSSPMFRLYNASIIKFFATSFDSVKADQISDVYFPPKV